jgi:biotin carboxyl carrier protein
MNGRALVLVGLIVVAASCQRESGAPAERGKEGEGGVAGGRAATDAAGSDTAGLTLDKQARTRAGIETTVLRAASHGGEIEMAGELIADPSQMTTVEAPVAGRLARVDGGHWPTYGEHVDAGTTLGQVSDAKPLVASRGGTVTAVGAQPGQMVQPGQLLLELHDLSAPLARVVWRADAPLPPPATVELAPGATPGGRAGVIGHLVGPAPGVDSLTRFPAYLYRAERSWPGASLGAPVEARVRGAGVPRRGLFVPAAAVVQWEGLAWVYVESAGDRYGYARQRVDTSHPVVGGWLVPEGALTSGEAVVVRGAQQLLSEEFKSRATTGDDDP